MRDRIHPGEPPLPPDGMPTCITFVIAMQMVLIAIFLILAALTGDWERLRFWILALSPLEIAAPVSIALYFSGQQSCNLHLAILALAAFCTMGLLATNLGHVSG